MQITKRELHQHYMDVRRRLSARVLKTESLMMVKLEEPKPRLEIDFTLPSSSPNKLKMIVGYVSRLYGFTPADIYSSRRPKKLAECRKVVYFIARQCTLYSYPQIGKHLKKDHTSVLFGCTSLEERMKTDADFRKYVLNLCDMFTDKTELSKDYAVKQDFYVRA